MRLQLLTSMFLTWIIRTSFLSRLCVGKAEKRLPKGGLFFFSLFFEQGKHASGISKVHTILCQNVTGTHVPKFTCF